MPFTYRPGYAVSKSTNEGRERGFVGHAKNVELGVAYSARLLDETVRHYTDQEFDSGAADSIYRPMVATVEEKHHRKGGRYIAHNSEPNGLGQRRRTSRNSPDGIDAGAVEVGTGKDVFEGRAHCLKKLLGRGGSARICAKEQSGSLLDEPQVKGFVPAVDALCVKHSVQRWLLNYSPSLTAFP